MTCGELPRRRSLNTTACRFEPTNGAGIRIAAPRARETHNLRSGAPATSSDDERERLSRSLASRQPMSAATAHRRAGLCGLIFCSSAVAGQPHVHRAISYGTACQ